jgi:hypothetical protein
VKRGESQAPVWLTEESHVDEERSGGEERRKPIPMWLTEESYAHGERNREEKRRKHC